MCFGVVFVVLALLFSSYSLFPYGLMTFFNIMFVFLSSFCIYIIGIFVIIMKFMYIYLKYIYLF